MHVMSKDSILEAAKRAFASEFIVGDAESHPREFEHWYFREAACGRYWGIAVEILQQS